MNVNNCLMRAQRLHDILRDVSMEVLRVQPDDLDEFLADYFEEQWVLKQAAKARTEAERVTKTGHRDGRQQQAQKAVCSLFTEVQCFIAAEPEVKRRTPCKDIATESQEKIHTAGPTIRRAGMSAEQYDPEADTNIMPASHPKTEDQRKMLQDAVKDVLLFKSLEEELHKKVIDAMFEKRVRAGEYICRQGEEGDNFYIIEYGVFDCFMRSPNDPPDRDGKLILTYHNRGSFGELALMYSQPRSASVVAVLDGVLWAMDRISFRHIVVKSAYQKRKMYMEFLAHVPMLETLSQFGVMGLCDALTPRTYEDGERIVEQGENNAEGMFFIEQGLVRATVFGEEGGEKEKEVGRLGVGQYFGEIALLRNSPRSANVYAVGRVKLAFLERGSFERLLGPCVEIMNRNIKGYANIKE